MSNQWFRSWHGAPTDPKWLGIARKASVAPGIVAALVWALLDRASQASTRGSIEGYDADGLACFMGCETEQVEHIIALMHEKQILENNTFSGWEKHQPVREDNSAERAKAWREQKKVSANATERKETLDTDTDTDTERKIMSETSSDLPVAKPKKQKADYPDDFETFWKAFPTDPGMSKAEAFKTWPKLSQPDRDQALAAIPAFKEWVSKQGKDYRTVHACRYLSQRRFDGFAEIVTASLNAPSQIFVTEGSVAFEAWERHRGRSIPATENKSTHKRGWYFPTEFPPNEATA